MDQVGNINREVGDRKGPLAEALKPSKAIPDSEYGVLTDTQWFD